MRISIYKKDKHFLWVKTTGKIKGINFRKIEKDIYKIPITPYNLFQLTGLDPNNKQFKILKEKEERYLTQIKRKTWGVYFRSLLTNKEKVNEIRNKLEKRIELIGDNLPHQTLAIYMGTILPSIGLFIKMGLGKTIISIHIMKFRMFCSGVRRTWIIAPKEILDQWKARIEEFFPELKGRISIIRDLSTFNNRDLYSLTTNVILCNYEKIYRILNKINSVDMLILDESTLVKNPKALRTKAMLELSTKIKFKLLLTGTPIVNTPEDIWSQYYIINPYTFDSSYYGFRYEYFKKTETGLRKWVFNPAKKAHFSRLLYTQAIRFTMEDKGMKGKMPKITTYYDPVEFGKKHREIYNEVAVGIVKELEKIEETKLTKGLPLLNKLRQVTSGFLIINDKNTDGKIIQNRIIRLPGTSPKLANIALKTERAIREKSNVIIVTNFIYTGVLLEKLLNKVKGINAVIFNGSLPKKVKKQNMEDFKKGKANVLISQLRTGGLGHDLDMANIVIFAEADYAPKINEQAKYRIRRLTQKKECFAYYVYIKNTIDEKILFGNIKTKEMLINSIIETIS